jgi:hypothetical protein
MPERVPHLVLVVLACRRHLVVFFSRRHTYLSSSSSRRPPWVGVYHCLGRPRHSIVSMGVRRPLRCHRPRRSAVGSPHRPSSVASTDVGVCALKDKGPSPLERKPPPPKSTLSTESKESTTRRSSETLMRLAQTGAIAKAARRTAYRNLMASSNYWSAGTWD